MGCCCRCESIVPCRLTVRSWTLGSSWHSWVVNTGCESQVQTAKRWCQPFTKSRGSQQKHSIWIQPCLHIDNWATKCGLGPHWLLFSWVCTFPTLPCNITCAPATWLIWTWNFGGESCVWFILGDATRETAAWLVTALWFSCYVSLVAERPSPVWSFLCPPRTFQDLIQGSCILMDSGGHPKANHCDRANKLRCQSCLFPPWVSCETHLVQWFLDSKHVLLHIS